MLEIRRLPRRAAVHSLMDEFDPHHSSWVVSDLRSKFEIQQMLLEREGGYLDTSVLRASDLWKTLLKKARPDMRVVSRDFIRSVVRAFLADHRDVLGKSVAAERSVLAAMDRFAPVVFHPRGAELMEEWFEANPDAKERWGESYFLARVTLGLVRDRGLVIAKWAAAVLQAEENFEKHWDSPLIVDLGGELTGAEAQLFLRLSKSCDVTLLQPFPEWRDEAEGVLRPYRDIEGAASRISKVEDEAAALTSRRSALRFSGQLAETKAAVGTVRRWLEEGVAPGEIAVLAPEIEDYWPVMGAYFQEEGVAVDKAVAVKLNSFPAVSKWLARLRPLKGDWQAADVELSFYATDASQRLRHEEFRALFTNLYGEEDLRRHSLVREALASGPKFDERMDRDAFLLASAFFWETGVSQAPLLLIAREILQNAGFGTELPLAEWIRYAEAVAASRELTVEPANPEGVLVANLASARTTRIRRRIFLGLTEEGLRKADANPLPLGDVHRLSDLGFHIEHPDHGAMEFELRWLSESASEEDVFLAGGTTFEGSVRAPASFWMRLHREIQPEVPTDRLSSPNETRWDRLQTSPVAVWTRERAWEDGRGERILTRLRRDLGDLPPALLHAPPLRDLSPSFVREYIDCPFQVAAKKLFRLKDLEEVDLDLARSGLGVLSHAVFQRLTDNAWVERASVPDEELAELITLLRDELGLQLAEEGWWEPLLRRQVRVAQEFLRVEREWKARFAKLKLHPSETSWTVFFDADRGVFTADPDPAAIRISGRIDRLESDGGERFVVVDYKAGAAHLNDQADWFKKNDLQLLFYMWALEKGAIEGVRGRVIGAFYYVYRDFSRTRGFQIEEEAEVLFPVSSSKSKRRSDEDGKRELFRQLEGKIAEILQLARDGHWEPQPRDEQEICGRCAWTGLCRAPHLS